MHKLLQMSDFFCNFVVKYVRRDEKVQKFIFILKKKLYLCSENGKNIAFLD